MYLLVGWQRLSVAVNMRSKVKRGVRFSYDCNLENVMIIMQHVFSYENWINISRACVSSYN